MKQEKFDKESEALTVKILDFLLETDADLYLWMASLTDVLFAEVCK